jgi:hypothetical protein
VPEVGNLVALILVLTDHGFPKPIVTILPVSRDIRHTPVLSGVEEEPFKLAILPLLAPQQQTLRQRSSVEIRSSQLFGKLTQL